MCYSIIGIVKTMQYTLKKFSNSELFNMHVDLLYSYIIQSYVVHICNFSSMMSYMTLMRNKSYVLRNHWIYWTQTIHKCTMDDLILKLCLLWLFKIQDDCHCTTNLTLSEFESGQDTYKIICLRNHRIFGTQRKIIWYSPKFCL